MRLVMTVVLFFAASFGTCVIPTLAQTYTKLAPTDPVIHLGNGQGSDRIYFSKSDATELPTRVKTTDATGRVNSLPASDIHVGDPTLVDKNVFSLAVDVKSSQYIEPGTPYEATLLLFDKNPATAPTVVKIKIEDDAVVSFDVAQTSITISLADAAGTHQRIRVKNTGKATITVFEVTSSLLSDTTNAHRIQMDKCERRAQLLAGQPMDLDFDLPQPVWAGSYTGTVFVTANRSVDKSLAVTIQSRGPLSGAHIPLVVFALVVIFGFTISSVLDSWFGSGGLARAQAYISLKHSETDLTDKINKLSAWQAKVPVIVPPISVPRANLWIAQALHDLQALWSGFNDRSVDQLTADAQNYATLTSASDLLWSCIETATSQWTGQPQVLTTVVTALDAVQLPQSATDLLRYRKDLTNALIAAIQSVHNQNAFARVAPQSQSAWPTLNSIRAKIRGMTGLYQVIVWCVVFVTAYQSFYAGHLLFGTLSDYMAVFLWSLGLTSTGTQIVSRVHKP
jgi:hypothetical protein